MSTFSITEHGVQLQRLADNDAMDRRIRLRAQILLFSAQLQSVREVAQAADTCVLTVKKWQRRFAENGVQGLMADAPRPGRPRKVDASLRDEIRSQGGLASTRALACRLGVSRSTVHRILRSATCKTGAA